MTYPEVSVEIAWTYLTQLDENHGIDDYHGLSMTIIFGE